MHALAPCGRECRGLADIRIAGANGESAIRLGWAGTSTALRNGGQPHAHEAIPRHPAQLIRHVVRDRAAMRRRPAMAAQPRSLSPGERSAMDAGHRLDNRTHAGTGSPSGGPRIGW
jgi:hypothetical protein